VEYIMQEVLIMTLEEKLKMLHEELKSPNPKEELRRIVEANPLPELPDDFFDNGEGDDEFADDILRSVKERRAGVVISDGHRTQ
jgi:hypothetical protein